MMKKLLFSTILSLFFLAGFSQDPVTFDNGSGDNLWGTPANWSGDAVPTSSDVVIIPASFDVIIAANTNAVAGTLEVNGSLNMAEDPTATLTVGTAKKTTGDKAMLNRKENEAVADNK